MVHKTKNKRKGFTLIEMVMVLVIIGLLAAIVVPQFNVQLDAAKEAQTQANLSILRSAISIYYKQNGMYPTTIDALTQTMGMNPAVLPNAPIMDGWSNPWIYNPADGAVHCDQAGTHANKCLPSW